jgi:4-amino-4-deoxy-L-arabinose transferase-like glycosyltransferase
MHIVLSMSSPLGFAIQAFFFRLVGNSWWTERLYTAIMLVITVGLIVGLWRRIFRAHQDIQAMAWLPVLIWILIPVCAWSYRQNMCENTMGIFTLSTIWLLYDNMDRPDSAWGKYALAGVFIFLAGMVKGLTGLYPLVFPVAYFIVFRSKSWLHVVAASLLMISVAVGLLGLVLLLPEARASLSIYCFERLLGRVAGDPTVANHFEILSQLFQELLIPIVLVMVAYLFMRKRMPVQNCYLLLAGFFMMLGLAGSLPLMLTRVQKAFYFVAALPSFAIASACIIAPVVSLLVNYVSARRLWRQGMIWFGTVAIIVIVVTSLILSRSPSRDQGSLHDVHVICSKMPAFTLVDASPYIWGQYSLCCYLVRYGDVSVNTSGIIAPYYLLEKGSSLPNPAYQKMDWALETLDVYQLIQNPSKP